MNQEKGTMITVDFEDGRSQEMSAAEIWKFIFNSNNPYTLSANGTIFRTDIEGVVPGLLSRWFNERTAMRKAVDTGKKLIDGVPISKELEESIRNILNR
jgi:hypothetical protein